MEILKSNNEQSERWRGMSSATQRSSGRSTSLFLLQEKEHFNKRATALFGLPWFEIKHTFLLFVSEVLVWDSMQLATQYSLSGWN